VNLFTYFQIPEGTVADIGDYRRQIDTCKMMRRYATSIESLSKTPLYDFHVGYNGKMVPFAGYSMPVQYANTSIHDSHTWTRANASLFDVSHMVQHRFSGRQTTQFLETITPSEISALKPFSSTLSVLMNESGGIVDDTVICRHDDNSYYIVTNAACKIKDLAYFKRHLTNFQDVEHEVLENWGLLALQGPKSAQVLQALTEKDLSTVHFGESTYAKLGGMEVHVARGGYTGEDGFEISVPPAQTAELATLLIANETVKLAGLGARDTLRLEAGMCLYGNDLDDTTSPVEAGLAWVISKARRKAGGFIGDQTVLQQFGEGVKRRRIGLTVEGAPARSAAPIESEKQDVGVVTSGCPSPTTGTNIAMGYITHGLHKSGTEIAVKVRGRERKAIVTKMPFVQTKYYK